ncbi:MAG: cytochrome P450 [Pseudomonadales bacterium]|nr:cytochrome P450 [Pseudomonadales bacterium]
MTEIQNTGIAGRNGVVIQERQGDGSGFRTYEVHQRERVGESTEKIKPVQLINDQFRLDPYPTLSVLRENYPFYRNWLSNNYWVTRYDDVTSVFVDEANFTSRTNAWRYGLSHLGRDLSQSLSFLQAEETLTDALAPEVAEYCIKPMVEQGSANLATDFAARFAQEMLHELLAIPTDDREQFSRRYWTMVRGISWQPKLQESGKEAIDALVEYFRPLLVERTETPGQDLVSALAGIDNICAEDIVATLLERDHETLHGGLANLWYLLLAHPGELVKAASDERLMRLAYLETIRHSPPTLFAERYARHEVERFGKLIPTGSLLICSAAAANRDPRIFQDPERFLVDRMDLCQREPRGQYRADGLASGIAFGLGKPTIYPAVPEDRPRSRYALTRDTVVTASMKLLQLAPDLILGDGDGPKLVSLAIGEMRTCWQLPVRFGQR